MMRRVLILLAACSSSPRSEPIANAKQPPPIASVCPQSIDHAPWLHDLFPACPPPPFWLEGPTCKGGCPKPCRARFLDESGRRYGQRFVYKQNGALDFTLDGWDARIDRMSTEPVPTIDQQLAKTIKRDEAGRVTAYDHVTLEYVDGRLVTEREAPPRHAATVYKYTYDDAGRVTRIVSSGWGFNYETTFAYEHDRLVKKVLTMIGADDGPIQDYDKTTRTMTIEWDAQGRPARIELSDPRAEQVYFYDCTKDASFDGAVEAMARFKARACACNDSECGTELRAELRTWTDGLADSVAYAEPNEQQKAAYWGHVRKAQECYERAEVAPPPIDPLQSKDILARTTVAKRAKVQHILLGWKKAHDNNPRGANRDRATLEALVKDTLAKLAAGTRIEDVIRDVSEDERGPEILEVTPSASFVKEYIDLALRLNVGEVGIIKTRWGIMIVRRRE